MPLMMTVRRVRPGGAHWRGPAFSPDEFRGGDSAVRHRARQPLFDFTKDPVIRLNQVFVTRKGS